MNNIVSKYFPSVSAKQWKQKIQYLLKGESYQNLVYTTIDGINILPFYSKENNSTVSHKLPLEEISTSIPTYYSVVLSAEKANKEALLAIENKITCIYFAVFDPDIDLKILLKNINLPVFIQCYFLNPNFEKQIASIPENCTFLYDCLGKISKTGNWYHSAKSDFNSLANLLTANQNELSINLCNFHNAGASQVQQLSYAFAQLISYTKNTKLNTESKINYLLSVSTDVFTEVAKIHALRILHRHFASKLNLNIKCCIIQHKSKRNLSGISTEINAIDAHTENYIAQLGGVNYFTSRPVNYHFYEEDIPTTQNTIDNLLKATIDDHSLSESVVFLEKTTEQLVEKSLLLIETLEKGGGFIEQLKKGTIQQKIAQNEMEQSKELAATAKLSMPQYTNCINKTPIRYPFLKKNSRKTLWQPIIEKQWRATFELPIWKDKFDV